MVIVKEFGVPYVLQITLPMALPIYFNLCGFHFKRLQNTLDIFSIENF